jgi:uncharacterized protein YuzE
MKLHYYPETDSLYIDLASKVSVDSREISQDLIADYDEDGKIVGLDIQHASEQLDLDTVEAESLPLKIAKSA